ncbi:MAG: TPM domain-containing protein [Thermosynechococcaceae cyanobacterium]
MNQPLQFPRQWRKLLQSCFMAIAVLLLTLPAGFALATGVADVPVVTAGSDTWVIDQGDVLSVLNQGTIAKKLSKLDQQTGNEVRFLTIRRFDYGETATTLAQGVFERWFPTAEAQANQVLLLLDTQTKTAGIQTGENIKSLMSDAIAQSIATETTLVPIRAGNYNQGLLDAANRLVLVLSGQPDPGPPEIKMMEVESTFKPAAETDTRSAAIIVVVLLLAATIIPMATYYWYQRN